MCMALVGQAERVTSPRVRSVQKGYRTTQRLFFRCSRPFWRGLHKPCHVSNRRTQPEQRDGLRIDAFIYTLTIAIVMHAECGGNGNPG